MPNAQHRFGNMAAEVLNSTVVFQLNISNNISFCASKSRPNAKPRNVGRNGKKTAEPTETLKFKTKQT